MMFDGSDYDSHDACREGHEFSDGDRMSDCWDGGSDEFDVFDCPEARERFRKAHGIPEQLPAEVMALLRHNRRPSSLSRGTPEIVSAAGSGNLDLVKKLVSASADMPGLQAAGPNPASALSVASLVAASADLPCIPRRLKGKQPPVGAWLKKMYGELWEGKQPPPKKATAFESECDDGSSHETDEDDTDVDHDYCSDNTKEYCEAVAKLGSGDFSWDPVRCNRSEEQLHMIASVELALAEEMGLEDDFETIVQSLVFSDLVERYPVQTIADALGMEIAEFMLDRLGRASALGSTRYEAYDLCRRMHQPHLLKSAAEKTRKKESELLKSLSAPNREAYLEGKAAAERRKAARERRARVLALVNGSRQWTEEGDYGKSWEWFGDTPLIAAARSGQHEVVRYLLRDCLADPTLESCPRCDVYETALGPTSSSCQFSRPQRYGGPTRQRVVERLVRAALSFWHRGDGAHARYSPAALKKRCSNLPTDVSALQAAVDAAGFNSEDEAALQQDLEAEAAQAAAVAAAAEMERRAKICGCGGQTAKDCVHRCCGNCCPGGCPRHGSKRRRLNSTPHLSHAAGS
eukprot:TRINITY_DN64435_c0_g1_i1.p1 TRINITY_DN64435_c0_g1~~TRINITY_DN64435_c0_g1_i1.p1  ORF type:complete len:585 (+),score=50.24 TRINITY_DN64435_c0_g1_i1:28-1755(+)